MEAKGRYSIPKFKAENGFSTTPERSKLMKKIKSKDTLPELKLRKYLWSKGIRYRVNVKGLPGSPDILIKRYKLVIFIDGEFWHGYNWEIKKSKISRNKDFWIPKIERTIERDIENNVALVEMGFSVIRFWEMEIRKDIDGCYNRLLSQFKIEASQ